MADGAPGPDAGTDHSAPDSAPTDAASADGGNDSAADGSGATPSGLAALPGYSVSIWATGGTSYTQPDSLEFDGTHVWVGYQMGVKTKDGTDAGAPFNSEVVEYNLDGTLTGQSFSIPGHCDGVRVNPTNHVVWATSNEDGNPIVESFDPSTAAVTTYALSAEPAAGGGLDDMAFFDGKLVVAESNPANNPNTAPALAVMNVSGSTITFSPFLMANAQAYNPVAGTVQTLNLQDPDSIAIDSNGDLVLVSQADSQLIVVAKGNLTDAGAVEPLSDGGIDAGTASVQVINVGTQLDDTVWATSSTGFLLVADEGANTIYAVRRTFSAGTVFTEAPDDSLVIDFVGTVDLTSGAITPIIIGFQKATGLLFVPQ